MKPVTMIAAAFVLSATAAIAGDKIATPQEPHMKIEKAQLAIKSPENGNCPAEARVAGWIFTNKAGPVSYLMYRKGGQVSAPKTIHTVKGPAGHVAFFSETFPVTASTVADYRILVAHSNGVVSNWAPLRVNCELPLGS